jgi:manganese/zinc/iron transport system substrate-binding protein
MQRRIWSLIIALAVCSVGERVHAEANKTSDRLTVVCTTTMIHDLVNVLAGDVAEVQGIMRPGEDPHTYSVRPRDAQMVAAADLVVANGLHLESTLAHVIEHRAGGDVVFLAEDERIKVLGKEAKQGAPDPHCWMNVSYFAMYAERARDALIKADSANEAHYREKATEFLYALKELDKWVTEQVAEVPRGQRVMVTSHDAFQYYGEAYDIDVLAVIGISTEQQPRPQDVKRLTGMVKERSVRALFVETSVSQTLNDMVRKIADRTGANIGGTLYSDSLGDQGTPGATYIGMIKHNTKTIVEALR